MRILSYKFAKQIRSFFLKYSTTIRNSFCSLIQYHSFDIYHHIRYDVFENPAVSSVSLLYHGAPLTACCHT